MIDIRAATPADAAAVTALLGQFGYDASPAAVAERIRHLHSTGADPVFLACDGAACRGLLALHIASMLQYARSAARITALVVDERGGRGVRQ